MRKPNQKEVKHYILMFSLLSVLFFLLYGSTNYLASIAVHHFQIFFEEEKYIPFYPEAIWIYFSINFVFLLPVFYLNIPEMNYLSFCFVLDTMISSFIFLLFPAELGFERQEVVPGFEFIYSLLYSVEYPHNLFPSLHVAYSYLIMKVILPKTNIVEKFFFVFWFLLLVLSVLFIHQHHIFDVISGIILSELVLVVSGYGKGRGWRFISGNGTSP